MQAIALSGATKDNSKLIDAAVGRYLRLRFPGTSSAETSEAKRMRQARELLAREVQKVYLIRPYAGDQGDAAMRATASVHPEFAKAAQKAMAIEHEQAVARQRRSQGSLAAAPDRARQVQGLRERADKKD